MPRSSHKHFVIQGIILTVWVILMVLAHGPINVESQFLCPDYKFLAPNPGWSWRPNKTITVSIDDGWEDPDRLAIIDGNIKWNSWNGGNCSGVRFVGFTPKTYTGPEYTEHPPDDNLYWQRTDPNNFGLQEVFFRSLTYFLELRRHGSKFTLRCKMALAVHTTFGLAHMKSDIFSICKIVFVITSAIDSARVKSR